jgi:hypothetical protein
MPSRAEPAGTGALVQQLANGDLLVSKEGAGRRRITKGTPEHQRLLDEAARGAVSIERFEGRFGGPAAPSPPELPDVVGRLVRRDATPREQRAAAADAAYGGGLSLRELTVLRRAGFLPYNKYDD